MYFSSLEELAGLAVEQNKLLSALIIDMESQERVKSKEELLEQMSNSWQVMREAMDRGLNEDIKSRSGLTGGDAKKLIQRIPEDQFAAGDTMAMAVARAIAVAEVNAAMGKIVATPTAGSCGVLPAVLATIAINFNKEDEAVVKSLFTAAGVGAMIEAKAFISGAAGGCQAEIGSAACMAAAAGVELMGGTPLQAINAGAIALKNMLGLVCDPVAGLVEVPCIKRNAIGTANALVAIDMSLADIQSIIPLDEVISAMREIGLSIPISLKETAKGGLANTPCARKLEQELNLGMFE